MSPWILIRRGLTHHWRLHMAVVAGIAVGTAVITGALLVGDSLRGSLRAMTEERLAGVETAVLASGFFRARLADEWAAAQQAAGSSAVVAPGLFLPGTLESPEQQRRAGRVQLLGIDERFATLTGAAAQLPPKPNQIVLAAELAEELDVSVGQEVIVRSNRSGEVPSESALGRKTETIGSRRLTVAGVLPPRGVGRFSLWPSQQAPRNAFVALHTLQTMVEQPERANTLLLGSGGSGAIAPLQPKLEDYGLELQAERGYWQLASRSLLLPEAAVEAADSAISDHPAQQVLTYLANRIAVGDLEVPYSTVAAVELSGGGAKSALPQLTTLEGQPLTRLAADEAALNAWTAEQLQARVGDRVELTYFEPESTHGQVRESRAAFRVAAIVALDDVAKDASWTPELPGVTDQLTIGDWSPPFPFDAKRVRKVDEEYWNRYRAAPKAFISMEAGQKLWASRFGKVTSLRIASGSMPPDPAALAAALSPAKCGWQQRAVRDEQLQASSGTTSFEGLFLGFSMFLIASAVLLVALLARLGIERRTVEVGVLSAAGVRLKRVRRWLLVEGALIAVVGAALGLPLAVAYARAMLWGLTTLWHDAVHTRFLEVHVTPRSLLIGWAAGVAVSLAATRWSLVPLGRHDVRTLLAGRLDDTPLRGRTSGRKLRIAAVVLSFVALAAAVVGFYGQGDAQIGSFFGAGAATLAAGLCLSAGHSAKDRSDRWSLGRLARLNAQRNRTRSALTTGMVASSVFLIAAIGAFQLDPSRGGGGGFTLLAESDQPLYQDLNDATARAELGFAPESVSELSGVKFYPLRSEPGEDASCLNLYQAARPRVVGVPDALLARGRFDWAAAANGDSREADNPWLLLQRPPISSADGEPTIGVVLDQNTAYYSLHLWGGVGSTIDVTDGQGQPLTLQVVGMLRNSLLQGELLISERDFLRYYPQSVGFRRWLIDGPPARAGQIAEVMEKHLGDYGFDALPVEQRLAEFFAVQNTYLKTFQSLGGWGLLLGTLGLAVVQLRSALERRGELALLRAVGLRGARLALLVTLETAGLLARGLACGLAGAAVALAPQLAAGAASVPWSSTLWTVVGVATAGLIAALIGTRAVLQAEILPALRGS